jgi:hypothetical protein
MGRGGEVILDVARWEVVDSPGRRETIRIKLTFEECLHAARVGAERRVRSLYDGRSDHCGDSSGHRWENNVIGSLGELAAANYLQVPWEATIDTYRDKPDIEPNKQIRTSSKTQYRLRVSPKDPDDFIVIHVTGKDRVFLIRGWMYAGECKREDWLESPHGKVAEYFVANHLLHHMRDLPDWKDRERVL